MKTIYAPAVHGVTVCPILLRAMIRDNGYLDGATDEQKKRMEQLVSTGKDVYYIIHTLWKFSKRNVSEDSISREFWKRYNTCIYSNI